MTPTRTLLVITDDATSPTWGALQSALRRSSILILQFIAGALCLYGSILMILMGEVVMKP